MVSFFVPFNDAVSVPIHATVETLLSAHHALTVPSRAMLQAM
jgi:hypothetical protein